jgi:hypothetical protein
MRPALLAVLLVLSQMCGARAAEPAVVYKSPTCDCCSKWVEHMQGAGFSLTPKSMSRGDLNRLKSNLGLKPEHAACHTAVIEGYIVEGHVPAADVNRLLSEKPDALGLTVPGMPIGSPGMEAGDQKESYDVLLVKKDGSTEVFAKH